MVIAEPVSRDGFAGWLQRGKNRRSAVPSSTWLVVCGVYVSKPPMTQNEVDHRPPLQGTLKQSKSLVLVEKGEHGR